ncbi:ABC transporter permease [Tessaracoccus sp. HDW20]|uniref:ABC transporter permease n=1 Tax=Tessaracoccus coleopterorum TaxID=2714950 RepID=UPI0018D32398|nr:ABC transporter permease [Tessaracoccus coleopterorum]NHB84349.1 ABC transporter permease [Tessaracoccus coleopterorum]
MKALGDVSKVLDGQAERNASLVDMTGDFDVFKYLLQGFAAIALLVGMITIANTFTILAAQRRRQLALLRTIGATPGQVTGRLLVESLLLGAIGSLLGLGLGFLVAWIGGTFTGSNFFGLTIVPLELTVAWLVGVLATVVAAVGPSLRAARVKPLEALQTVPTRPRRTGPAWCVSSCAPWPGRSPSGPS